MSRAPCGVSHEIASVYGEHFDRDGIFGDFLDHVLEVPELVGFGLWRAGAETVGDTDIHEIAHVLESDALDEAANRGGGHFSTL